MLRPVAVRVRARRGGSGVRRPRPRAGARPRLVAIERKMRWFEARFWFEAQVEGAAGP